jgi:LysR family transcriptional regulator, transcriptional activator of nhaA
MLNYHHLRYFWLVAKATSLTQAAKDNNISQSALSMQISTLETYLGQKLFDRKGRGLELTEAGQVALDFAESIFAKGEELEGTFGLKDHLRQNVLRVGALATLSRNFQITFLAPALAAEGVEVIIHSGTLDELLESLEDYQLDVILSNFVPPRNSSTRWVAHTIDQQPVSLIGRPLPQRDQLPLKTLLQDEPLVVPALQSSIRTGFDALVDRMKIQPKIVAQVDDMAMLRLVAREHTGLAVVPPIVVKDELAGGVLVEVAKLPGLAETFSAITLTRRFPNPLLKLVLPPDPSSMSSAQQGTHES